MPRVLGLRAITQQGVPVPSGTHLSDVTAVVASGSNPRGKIMARNQTNTLQARELTEAELDAVSGGDTKSKQTTDKQQAYLELTLLNTLTSSY